jgi:predicted AlkP superfamily pyrophosphatase or phosphodiesterase
LVDLLERDLKADAADFYFVYFAGVDAYLHAHADQPELVAEVLKQYELRLARVYQTAVARNGHARFHLFSDHGMAPTHRTVDIMAKLASLPFQAPRSYLALVDSTMVRFWFTDDAARNAIRSTLKDGEDGRWLSKCDKRLLHADFEDKRYGEEIFLLNEGVVAEPSHMGAEAPRGMHGFHPSAPHSYASFISSEDYGNSVSSITDIFGVMCERC